MALKMSSSSSRTPKPDKPTTISAQARTPPVFGPEPPPSMVRDKPKVQHTFPFPMMFRGGSDDVLRTESMRHVEGQMQQLFHSRLLSIMAEYGYTDADFSEADVASVMVARGLMKSLSDDPIVALASEVKKEMWQIVHGHLKHVTEASVDPSQLAEFAAADSLVFDALDDLEPPYPEDDEFGGFGVSYDDIIRIMRRYSVDDISSDPAAPSNPLKLPQPALPRSPLEHRADSGPAAGPGGTANKPDAEAKSQKKKKKRNKKKSRGKGKQYDECTQDEADDAALWPTTAKEAPGLASVSSTQLPQPMLPPMQSLPQHQQMMAANPMSGGFGWQEVKSVPPLSGAGGRNSIFKQSDTLSEPLWNNNTATDYTQVREFWLALSEIEQQALVMVEKEVVLARVRDQQNFSCSCSSCTRKREAIESELDWLYHCYYEELKENVRKAKLRTWISSAKHRAQTVILNSVEMITDSVVKRLAKHTSAEARETVQRSIIGSLKNSPEAKAIFGSEFYKLIELENALQPSSLAELGDVDEISVEAIRDAAELSLNQQISDSVQKYGTRSESFEKLAASVHKCLTAPAEGRQELTDQLLPGSDSTQLLTNNNDLFYTDQMLDSIDTFPADSKKFFEMMERLADYRIRREDAMMNAADGIANLDISGDTHDNTAVQRQITASDTASESMLDRAHRRCPDCHGEISESEGRQYYSDDVANEDDDADQANGYSSRKRARAESRVEYYDDEDDDEDEDDGEYEDEYSDEDDQVLNNDEDDLDDTDDDFDGLDAEDAEREIENGRKVFQLFAARLFEQRVVNAYREKTARDMQRDLIRELEREEERNLAKDKRKQKKKQREREKKRLAQQQREEQRQQREVQARADEERKRAEAGRRMQEEERKRREETDRVKQAQEERNRRILEQADRRLERERLERERQEKLRAERERKDREARQEKELLQKQESKQKAKAQQKLKQQLKSPSKGSVEQTAESISSSRQPVVEPISTPKQHVVESQARSKPTPSQPVVASTELLSSPVPTALHPASPAASHVTAVSAATSAMSVTPIVSTVSHPPALSSISLLDSLQLQQQQLTPTLAPVSAFKTSRPSLPMIHSHEPRSATPSMPTFPPMRARANSGPSTQQQQQQVPGSSFMPPGMSAPRVAGDVPPEIDAEISSIVGRVMGSSTLQGDLIDGTEWRASPADRYGNLGEHPHSSRSAVFGLGGPLAQLSDQAMRRNSMPLNNRLVPDDCVADTCSRMSLGRDEDIEAIVAAYNVLERFRRDSVGGSTSGLAQYGGYHRAADISHIHGRMSETEVWSRCVAVAQLGSGVCSVDHVTRAVAFARSSATTPPGAKHSPIGGGVTQSAQQLPAIAEDLFSAFNMQSTQTASPLMANVRAPLAGMAAHAQPCSPMMQSQALSGLGSIPAVGAQTFVQQPQRQQQAQSASSLFMGAMGMHASPNGGPGPAMMHHGTAPPPSFSIAGFPPSSIAGFPASRHLSDSPIGTMHGPLSMSGDGHMAYSLAYGPPAFAAPAHAWPSGKHGDGPTPLHPLHAFSRHPQAVHPQHPPQRSPGNP
ncbi:Stress response protein nst1 [Coemansia sp. RSA 521]|nr:Stress response protein nst1 [Coemansia sp. RSA 521]